MKPLHGLVVLDVSRVIAGPYAAMILAELGAEVIKVEQPGGDPARHMEPCPADGVSSSFLAFNRGKKSITLDLKSDEAFYIFMKLVARADIIIHNYLPATAEKLGLSYDLLQAINPKVVVVSCTGYGITGPYADKPVYDPIIQAETGLMSLTGDLYGPEMPVGIHTVDLTSGLWIALGAIAAHQSGQGTFLDYAMFDGQMSLMNNSLAVYSVTGDLPRRTGHQSHYFQLSGNFRCHDGTLNITAVTEPTWLALCKVLKLDDEWARGLVKVHDRVDRRHEIVQLVEDAVKTFSVDALLGELIAAKVPAGRVNDLEEALRHPQVNARSLVSMVTYPGVKDVKTVGLPFKFQGIDSPVTMPVPALGEHTDEVLRRYCGLTGMELKKLRDSKVI